MNHIVTYELKAYVDGDLVFNQIYPDTAELVQDLSEAEMEVEDGLHLSDAFTNVEEELDGRFN